MKLLRPDSSLVCGLTNLSPSCISAKSQPPNIVEVP
uniref:Uncharacterized protein n=1 Tax=Arundo donax TaxID=35708 RepID=A0A0A9GXC1_ARUDO